MGRPTGHRQGIRQSGRAKAPASRQNAVSRKPEVWANYEYKLSEANMRPVGSSAAAVVQWTQPCSRSSQFDFEFTFISMNRSYSPILGILGALVTAILYCWNKLHTREKWILCLIGKEKVIDFHSRIVIDLKKIRYVRGSANRRVYVTIGGDGENRTVLSVHQGRPAVALLFRLDHCQLAGLVIQVKNWKSQFLLFYLICLPLPHNINCFPMLHNFI